MTHSTQPIPRPNVLVSGTYTQGIQSPFEQLHINAETAGRLMGAFSMSAAAIAQTRIRTPSSMPRREVGGTLAENNEYEYIYTTLGADGRTVNLHLNNVIAALQPSVYLTHTDTPPANQIADQAARRHDALDLSGYLLEGLSYRADEAVMGWEALEQEQAAAERRTKRLVRLGHFAGAAVVTAGTAALAWLNHKTATAPVEAVDAAALLSTGYSWYQAALGVEKSVANRLRYKYVARLWPMDLRAKRRRQEYKATARDLVTYRLR